MALTEGEVFVSASLGVAISGGDRDTAARLLRDADTAMYMAKERGRARIEVFDPKSHGIVLDKIRIRNELHGALKRGEFRVYYQPIVEVSTGRVMGVEALLRWQHPERGLLHLGEFLAMAEENGLISPIGAWVLGAVLSSSQCRLGRRAPQRGFGAIPSGVSVNLSPRQLIEPDVRGRRGVGSWRAPGSPHVGVARDHRGSPGG